MGKRERKRRRENEMPESAGDRSLGAPGPFMVCRECREPLTVYTKNGERIIYIHPGEYLDAEDIVRSFDDSRYDHEAVPVESNPIDADTTCDFCHAPRPRWVFVPRRQVRIPDLNAPARDLDYSSPWSCCDGCMPAVKSRNMTRILNRAMRSRYSMMNGLTVAERQPFRSALRVLYSEYLKSDPAGPYEQKIRPEPKPFGKRGGRKGM